MSKRWLGIVFIGIALLAAMLTVSGCADGADLPSLSEEDRLVNQLFTIKGAEFVEYREGTDDPWSRGRPSLVWYRPEESRQDISPPRSGVVPELPGYYTYIITYFDERYAEGVYRYFTRERFLKERFDLVMFRVEMIDGGSVVHASLEKIERGDRSWSGSRQWSLNAIERLLSGLSANYLWKSQASLNAFLEQLMFAEMSVYEGRGYRDATQVHLRRAMEILFQDAFSSFGVSVFLVDRYCDESALYCTIERHTSDGSLDLGYVGNADKAVAALRTLPSTAKELIGDVEVLTLKDREFGVTWGEASYLGIQDKFGNWYILVPGE